jgi:hypothetical protein
MDKSSVLISLTHTQQVADYGFHTTLIREHNSNQLWGNYLTLVQGSKGLYTLSFHDRNYTCGNRSSLMERPWHRALSDIM